jgi:hypothetical protein
MTTESKVQAVDAAQSAKLNAKQGIARWVQAKLPKILVDHGIAINTSFEALIHEIEEAVNFILRATNKRIDDHQPNLAEINLHTVAKAALGLVVKAVAHKKAMYDTSQGQREKAMKNRLIQEFPALFREMSAMSGADADDLKSLLQETLAEDIDFIVAKVKENDEDGFVQSFGDKVLEAIDELYSEAWMGYREFVMDPRSSLFQPVPMPDPLPFKLGRFEIM